MLADAIAVDNLRVQKGRQVILDGLTFSIAPGSITGLIGPSGSGKTTLLRSLVGVQQITGGSVRILGLPAGSQQLRANIGYVTQAPAIYKDITVEQNLRYFASVLGVKGVAVKAALEAVDLQSYRMRTAGSLSGGQQARVSLAVALLADAKLLILDEPTVGLDPVLRENLWKLFHSLASQGRTLVVSSHVMDEAERCDRLLFIRNGRLLADASPAELGRHGGGSIEKAFIALAAATAGSDV